MQHPVLSCQQDTDLVICKHPMGMNLWPVFDLEGLPGVGAQLPFANTPVKELGHLLEDASLGLGCQSDALRGDRQACKANQASVLPLPVLADVGRELGDVPQHLLSMCEGEVTNSVLAQV